MTNVDTVLVKPTTDYFEGWEHKSAASPAYPVSRSYGLELQGQGFAEIVEPTRKLHEQAPAAETPSAEPEAPKRRGRPPRAA